MNIILSLICLLSFFTLFVYAKECTDYNDCSNCIDDVDENCGWCSTTNTCEDTMTSSCTDFLPDYDYCPCVYLKSCHTCAEGIHGLDCGWCGNHHGSCLDCTGYDDCVDTCPDDNFVGMYDACNSDFHYTKLAKIVFISIGSCVGFIILVVVVSVLAVVALLCCVICRSNKRQYAVHHYTTPYTTPYTPTTHYNASAPGYGTPYNASPPPPPGAPSTLSVVEVSPILSTNTKIEKPMPYGEGGGPYPDSGKGYGAL